MSRHSKHIEEFNGKDGRWEVAFGWDRPLASFFVQVFDELAADDEEYMVLNVGCELEKNDEGKLVEVSYRSIQSLLDRLGKETSTTLLDKADLCQLLFDQEVEGMGLTQFQKNTMKMFDELANVERQPRE